MIGDNQLPVSVSAWEAISARLDLNMDDLKILSGQYNTSNSPVIRYRHLEQKDACQSVGMLTMYRTTQAEANTKLKSVHCSISRLQFRWREST